jgi:hypothetical protein
MKTDLIFLKPMQHICKQDYSCFYELIDLWYENDFCEVKPIVEISSTNYNDSTLIPESRFWVNEIGDILLYNQPILDKLPSCGWNKALFANEVLKKDNCFPWIFWPRFVKQYYNHKNYLKPLSYEERNIKSIFIGNFTTNKRGGEWGKHIEFFNMGSTMNHNKDCMRFSYDEYLKLLGASRFGLCLPGVGKKCLRDVENMGIGTVPIFTPGVSTNYFDKLEKDKHFLFVSSPKEVEEVMNNCTKEKWSFLSHNCKEWFKKNCSLEGSFKQTMEIINKIK